jgi:hypothetical protein
VEELFGLPALTKRDGDASTHSLKALLLPAPREDSPGPVTMPAPQARPEISEEARAAHDANPLPAAGNIHGFLLVAAKTEIELSDGSAAARQAIIDKYRTIKTHGDAKQYMGSVAQKMEVAKARLDDGGER